MIRRREVKDRTSYPADFDAIGPDAVEVLPRRICAGDTWSETLLPLRWPAEVSAGWLAPLASFPGSIDVALHVDPMPNDEAARHLRRQLARLESTRRIEAKRGQLPDPELEAAASDAGELGSAVARGESRLYNVGFYVAVRGPSQETLAVDVQRVEALCRSMLFTMRPARFRALEGWTTTLPVGIDALRMRRTFDTRALAAAFPFASAEIEGTSGILYGRNATTGGLVFVDRFSLDNPNQVILATSGAGKSYLAKLQILRSLYRGVEVLVIDPENEYLRLARAVGGTDVCLGTDGARLNPLDLAAPGRPEALRGPSLFLQTLAGTFVGGLSPAETAVLDRATIAAYAAVGITADLQTHARPAPLLGDVVAELERHPGGKSLADVLRRYTEGSFRGLFDTPTTFRPEGHLVVFSLQNLPDELKLAGTLLAMDAIWRRVAHGERRPRIVVIDEAWLLLGAGGDASARFIQRLAKSARKHWCGLTTITQDIDDVISTEFGRSVVNNAAHKVLLRQEAQAIEALAKTFNLSDGEKSFILACDRGEGILICAGERAAIRVVASEREHLLATSDPAELASLEDENEGDAA